MSNGIQKLRRRDFVKLSGAGLMAGLLSSCSETGKRPNFLFIITDDQSWEHAACYGDRAVRTPNIDRLAERGVTFNHAYCAAPSCSPSRAAILTGQDIYRLQEGGILTGFIREEYEVFPRILEKAGYAVGNTGKPYWPRTADVPGSHIAPAGRAYRENRLDAPKGISRHDYAANFNQFLDEKEALSPFFFWVGIAEPHLPHPTGLGRSAGIDSGKIRIPAFYSDTVEIRSALSDYLAEIEWADRMLGRILASIEKRGLLENTLIVFTSDNGMPFPRAKATLYDHGVRMPLICQWAERIKGGRSVDDPVSLIDLAPTFLELAGLDAPEQMTGRSLAGQLFTTRSGLIDKNREFVVSAFEKHTSCREGHLGFPRRALHSREWTYIRNFEPERWPAGAPDVYIKDWGVYGDVDPSGIKSYFSENRDQPAMKSLFDLSFGKVPAEELYDKVGDPDMINNLAADPHYRRVVSECRSQLENYLQATDDPRMRGLSPWDSFNLDKPLGAVIRK